MRDMDVPSDSTVRHRALWLFLLFGLVATVVVWQSFLRASASEAKALFEARSDSVAAAIIQRMHDHEQILLGSVGLFDASTLVDRDDWHTYIARMALSERYPGVFGVGFAEAVAPAQLQQHIAAVRSEGFPFYRVTPEGTRDLYTPIVYIEPFSGRNLAAFGYDMFSEPTRQRAMRRAVDEGETAMTARVTLVQENQGQVQPGFLMYAPVYHHGAAVGTAAQRWQALAGFVYSPFRMFDLMSALFPQRDVVLDFSLYDGDSADAKELLFTSVPDGAWSAGHYSSRRTLELYGNHWTLVTTSRSAFDAKFESGLHWMVLILGCALSVAVFLALRGQVSARQQAERIALEKTHVLRDVMRLNDSILSSAAFSIISTRADGVITSFNSAAERMLGYRAEELVGKQTPALIHLATEVVQRAQEFGRELSIDLQPGFDVFVIHSKLKLPNEYEWTYVKKDGGTLPVLLSVTAMRDEDDNIIGYLGIAVDITDRRRAQGALVLAREAAEAANRAKSEFVANMSHEIRTPLNAVLGLTRIVLGTELDARQRSYLTKVISASTTLLGILNDILDYSKIEAGKLELEQVDFELTDLFESASVLFSMAAEEKNIGLTFDIDPQLPTNLSGDPLRLGQIINNLVGNAIKFTDTGEVRVVAERHDLEDHSRQLRIIVSDSGIGISAEQQARLFQAFMQADTSTTRTYGGSGLGLAICQHLLTMMGGSIHVSSEPGKGSRFICAIPLLLAARTTLGRSPVLLKRMKVLVVHAGGAAKNALQSMMQEWQFDVIATTDIDDAVMLLTTSVTGGEAFDLVLVDTASTAAASLKMVEQIRQQEQSESLPRHALIVVANASVRELLLQSSPRAAIDGLLDYPVLSSQLFDLVLALQHGHALLPARGGAAATLVLSPTARAKRVLLVEDNALNQIVAGEMLAQLGLQVDVAEDGEQAIEMARHQRYGVILMDIHMPRMDGLAATRAIRATSWGVDVPIVAMTAAAMQQDREATRAAGMNAHIAKPIDPDELIKTLQRWLSPTEPASQAQEQTMNASESLAPTALQAINDSQQPSTDDWLSAQQLQDLLPAANVEAALKRLRKLPRIRDLLRAFQTQYTAQRNELAALIERRHDDDSLYRIAHDLKAVAGNVGFDVVSVAAGEVCAVLKSNNDLAAAGGALLSALDAALAQLQRVPLH